jgi:SET family sugar efflux transporter-like MFS transporter
VSLMRLFHRGSFAGILNPLFIRLYAAVVVVGTALAIESIILPLYATRELGLSLGELGVFLAAVSLIGIPVNILVGWLSDRARSRRLITSVSAGWVCIGYFALSVNRNYFLFILIGSLFLSVMSTVNAQTLTFAREAMETRGVVAPILITSLRSGYSLGYSIGPLLAALLLAITSARMSFAVCGLLYAANIAAILTRSRKDASNDNSDISTVECQTTHKTRRSSPSVQLWLLGAALALIFSSLAIRASYTLIFATTTLHYSPRSVVWIFAVGPFVEVVLLPACGALAHRYGAANVVIAGSVMAAIDLFATSVSTAVWQLAILQILDASVVASVAGVGLVLLQDTSRGQIGLGTSIFISARTVGNLLGGSLGGIVAQLCGLRWAFGIAGLWTCLGLIILVTVIISHSRSSRAQVSGEIDTLRS